MTIDLTTLARTRRTWLTQMIGASAALLLAGQAQSHTWPTRPVRLVLGYSPGGSADVTARELTPALHTALGQPFVVDYKTGASGSIAAGELARATPDGYTLGLVDNAPLTIVPTLRNTGYHPLTDFTFITVVSHMPQVLIAAPATGVTTVGELLDALRQAPQPWSYASGGVSSVGHLTAELFKSRTNTQAQHIPYRGGSQIVNALLTGEVQFAFVTQSAASAFIQAGQLKGLGVSSRARVPSMPDVPTIAEVAIPGFEAPGWFALMGPAGLPEDIVSRLRSAVHDALAAPEMVAKLARLGQTVAPTGQDMRALIAGELTLWEQVITEQNLSIET